MRRFRVVILALFLFTGSAFSSPFCGVWSQSVTNNSLSAGTNYLTGSAVGSEKIMTSFAMRYTGTVTGVTLSGQQYQTVAPNTVVDFYPIAPPVSGNWYLASGEWQIPINWTPRLLVVGATAGDSAAYRVSGYTVCSYYSNSVTTWLNFGVVLVLLIMGSWEFALMFAVTVGFQLIPAGSEGVAGLVLCVFAIIRRVVVASQIDAGGKTR